MHIGMIMVAGMGGAAAMLGMLLDGESVTRAFVVGYAGGGFVIALLLAVVTFALETCRERRAGGTGSAAGPAQNHADCAHHR